LTSETQLAQLTTLRRPGASLIQSCTVNYFGIRLSRLTDRIHSWLVGIPKTWVPGPTSPINAATYRDLGVSNDRLTHVTVAATRVKSLVVFVFHQFVGTWGIAFLAAFGLSSLFDVLPDIHGWKPSMRFVHWLLTENPFYPVQILTGLYFGWLLGRRFQHRSMLWIWVLPLAILTYCFIATALLSPWASMLLRPESVRARLSFYFGSGCQPRDRCIDQLLITMPFYASVAYSLGALLARNASTKVRQHF